MNIRRTGTAMAAMLGLTLLAACGGGSEETAASPAPEAEEVILANGMTPKEQIEARQASLKDLGKNFKAISDQLKSGSPDVAVIQEAAANVPVITEGMDDWFPAGTGPESGVKTDALPVIWEDSGDFAAKVADFHAAAATLASTAEGGDLAAIGEAFGNTGAACKACHQKFRADD